MSFPAKSPNRQDMSLNRVLRLSGAALVGLMLFSGGTGIGAAVMQSSALQYQTEASSLFSNHERADMMHDAIRSDVLAAFQSSEPGSDVKYDDIMKDLKEHVADLQSGIAADTAYSGSADVVAVTSKLAAPMKSYVDAATDIIGRIKDDPKDAKAMLPKFFEQFRALETSMGAASDAIDANIKASAKTAERIGTIAIISLFVTLALGIAGMVGFVMLSIRKVVRPIEGLAVTMRELGAGNLAAEVTGAERGDELGDMAKAMLAFRNQLQSAEASKAAQAELIVKSVGTGLTALAEGDLTARVDAELQAPFTSLKDNFNAAVASLRALILSVSESATAIRTGSS